MKRATIYRHAYSTLARLPWWYIGLLSRVLAVILYAVVRYRRAVVAENLRLCLPELSERERRDVAWDFYHHLVHQFLSAPRILSADAETLMREHIVIEGMDELEEVIRRQGSKASIILMGHIGNWEIFSAANHYFARHGLQLEQLYRPLKDTEIDAVQRYWRMRHGSITTPKAEIGRRLISLIRDPEATPTSIAFIADQTPARHLVGQWVLFLHRMTAFLDGAERLARKYDLPVHYFDIRRVTNRKYEGKLMLIAERGGAATPGEITRTFARMLEATIRRDPAIWLWSHKRWKHTPPEGLTPDGTPETDPTR